MDIQTIQAITSVAALLLGLAYVAGGLVVNLHLAYFGVTEYQILRIKYLVVGLIFLANSLAVLTVAAFGSFLLLLLAGSFNAVPFFIISLAAGVILIGLWNYEKRIKQRRWSGFQIWSTFAILGGISLIYPFIVFYRQAGLGAIDVTVSLQVAGAVLVAVLAIIGEIHYYARYIYGSATALDPIGMGIPIKVKLAGKAEDLTLLTTMGIPGSQPDLTDTILMLDETDEHYIVGVGSEMDLKVFKISKVMIKGIVYQP